MIKANVLKLADHIEAQGAEDWSMTRYMTRMGSGMLFFLAGEAASIGGQPGDDLWSAANRFLGISVPALEGRLLFMPEISTTGYNCRAWPGDNGFITHLHVVRCLRHYAETGRVDWIASFPFDEHTYAHSEEMRIEKVSELANIANALEGAITDLKAQDMAWRNERIELVRSADKGDDTLCRLRQIQRHMDALDGVIKAVSTLIASLHAP